MKKITLTLTVLFVSFLIFACPAMSGAKSPVKKVDLRILYVGGSVSTPEPEGSRSIETVEERIAAFESLLKDYFTVVKVIRADDYTPEMSHDYDVTVMDGRPKVITPRFRDDQKGIYRTEGRLPEDFARPMLTIGEASETTGRRIGTKNDWYCLCLDADAHHWRAGHAIFNGPFEVRMTVVDKPTPKDAYHYSYYYDGTMPDQIPMWRVQTDGYMTNESMPIGMVSRPWGYEDSPDAEYISSGVCAKTLDAVAIGRHGNFFHWGFAASPNFMTEEAKPVFANAIVYIAKFAGQTPIARKYNDRIATREYIKELKYLLTREYYEERKKSDAEWAEQMLMRRKAAEEKKARGEKLTPNETQMLTFTPSTEGRTLEQHLERYGKNFYKMFGTDIPAYGRYFDENYDYFFGEGFYHIEVDEDVKSLGIPNYDKRILDAAIKLLETGKDAAKGRRILARYTLADFSTPAEWRNWYETYKNRMFWTESCGWLFLIDSREPGLNDYRAREERRAAREMAAGETSDAEPVALSAEAVTLHNGSKVLYIKAKIHAGYYIYDNVDRSDAFNETIVEVTLPDGYKKIGDLNRPFGKYYNQNGTTIYDDTVVFTQEFTGEGAGELKCRVSYQCCDAHICFPPQTRELIITVK